MKETQYQPSVVLMRRALDAINIKQGKSLKFYPDLDHITDRVLVEVPVTGINRMISKLGISVPPKYVHEEHVVCSGLNECIQYVMKI